MARRSIVEQKIDILKTASDPMLITNLMKETGIRYSTLKSMVEGLVKKGMIEANPIKGYSRLVLLKTTEKGLDAVKAYESAAEGLT